MTINCRHAITAAGQVNFSVREMSVSFNVAFVAVGPLESGKTLFESQADRLLSPASNCKLYTGPAAAQNRQRNFPAHPHGPERARKKRCKSFGGGTMFSSNTPLVATRLVNAVQLTRFVEVSMT